MDFSHPQFWIGVLQIIAIDILLGGDNAVVIALACRKLPASQRNLGIFWGVIGAIALRILLLFFAVQLLAAPGLKTIGAALLIWIGVKLLVPENEEAASEIEGPSTLLGAVKTVVVADAVMSMDNVVAVAGAARDNFALVVLGILVSIPVIVWGSKLVLALMDRFAAVVTLGAALLGWIAGQMIVGDRALGPWLADGPAWARYAIPLAGAVAVIAIGKWLARRREIRLDSPEDGGSKSESP